MKRRLLFLLLGGYLCATAASAQITLQECRQKAQANYPLVKQYRLLELSAQYDLENAAKGNLPQLSVSGKASYQSDATKLPFTMPGISFTGLPKEQYQVVAEVKQNIWDGGAIRAQKKQTQAVAEEALRQTDTSLYRLNERVDQLFFGILLQEEQLRQNRLLLEELERNRKQVESYIRNGVANEADMDAIRTEILSTRQKRIAIEADKQAYVRMLALLTNEQWEGEVTLAKPELPLISSEIHRPELAWYAARLHRIDTREQALKTAFRPHFMLFAQGGAGNPGLNMLKSGFEPFYIIGAKMSWNFSPLYTLKNDRLKLEAQRQSVANEREAFLLDTRIQMAEQEKAAEALRRQMEEDDEIIRLRNNVRKAAEAKVAGGTLSVTEMLRELTNESLARQEKALHEIQWLMTLYRREYLTRPHSEANQTNP